ncbi:cell wall hydrolase [Sinisalibacter aestuarii]|uniref:Cell wall hydrolase n=2 Tax=Sinisalibacter aestuarii TaxID=2949426 RepID=A0ABQ5LU89_9RHOB|nr:cell wall hydrolase [Sinisalibacter aestuarii]
MMALAVPAGLAGCGMWRGDEVFSSKQQECMARAMYFESNRSSRDGMIAVGSVVMNRVASADFPNDVCAVVGQRNQFAPGVMSKPMKEDASRARVAEAAAAVLAGERHPNIENARFFHMASYNAGYDNMHYVLTTGGNAFYEKRRPEQVTQPRPVAATEGVTR